MNESKQNFYNPLFHHIYVEKKALEAPMTQKILSAVGNTSSQILEIDHYKDIFNRNGQSFHTQKQAPALILAVKEGTLVYHGAPVCQNFGEEHFYYTSCMMNCLYDCEYCYLQGMYPSANLVVFVNQKDIFAKVHELLQQHPVYLCISYDTDLLALEPILGMVHEWIQFVENEPDLTVELRTKSANLNSILDTTPNERFVIAWTVSPEEVASAYEHHAPSTKARLSNVAQAMQLGYPVRLCFDPMLYVPNWKENYYNLIETISETIEFQNLRDVSLGVFRISADYMSLMRKQRPDSIIVNYPYQNDHGVFHIDTKHSKEIIRYVKDLLLRYLPEEKLFIWEETT